MKTLMNYIAIFCLSLFSISCSGEGLIRDFEDDMIGPGADQTEKLRVNVGSYNLRLLTTADVGVRDWENRKQWVRRIVDVHDFDVIGTQEGYISQLNDIVDGKDYEYVAVGRDDGIATGETCGILYKKDKFTVEDKGTFWLSQTPDVPSYGWDANIRRICTWVQFKEVGSEKKFFVFNAHYDHQGNVAKLESSKLMLEKIATIAGDEVVVMTGDFNALPETEPITTLLNSEKLWDSKAVTMSPALGPEGTSYGYDLSVPPTSRIDYVLVSRHIDVLQYQVIDDDFTTQNIASDHLPVLARVQF